jgi:DNA-directed RNA polymerase sigma subunit (sigma70/sigma32)
LVADERFGHSLEKLEAGLPGALSALSSREQEVVRRCYGLDGQPQDTQALIGRELGISRERVRQILRDAEQKIKRLLCALTRGE